MDTATEKQPTRCVNAEALAPAPPVPATSQPGSPRSARVFAWLRNVPFIAMNLSCLAVFLVSPDWLSLVLCAVLFFTRMLGVTAGYHRYFAHRSYKTSRLFQFALACLGCSSMQKGPLWWVAHHRQHHRHT